MKKIKLFYQIDRWVLEPFENEVNKFVAELQNKGNEVIDIKLSETDGVNSVMIIYDDTINFNK